MKKYDALIIGFGKGGKTLAAALGKKGIKTAVIEKSPLMYGGTCINIGCIPTKKLIHTAADAKKNQQADYSEKNNFYAAAIREKNTLTALLRQKNYDNVAAAADIYTAEERGPALGFFTAFIEVGIVVGAMGLGFITEILGYANMFALSGIIVLVITLAFWLLVQQRHTIKLEGE